MSKGTPRDPMRLVSVILRRSQIEACRDMQAELDNEKHLIILQMLIDRWNVSPKYTGRDQQYSFSTKGRTP